MSTNHTVAAQQRAAEERKKAEAARLRRDKEQREERVVLREAQLLALPPLGSALRRLASALVVLVPVPLLLRAARAPELVARLLPWWLLWPLAALAAAGAAAALLVAGAGAFFAASRLRLEALLWWEPRLAAKRAPAAAASAPQQKDLGERAGTLGDKAVSFASSFIGGGGGGGGGGGALAGVGGALSSSALWASGAASREDPSAIAFDPLAASGLRAAGAEAALGSGARRRRRGSESAFAADAAASSFASPLGGFGGGFGGGGGSGGLGESGLGALAARDLGLDAHSLRGVRNAEGVLLGRAEAAQRQRLLAQRRDQMCRELGEAEVKRQETERARPQRFGQPSSPAGGLGASGGFGSGGGGHFGLRLGALPSGGFNMGSDDALVDRQAEARELASQAPRAWGGAPGYASAAADFGAPALTAAALPRHVYLYDAAAGLAAHGERSMTRRADGAVLSRGLGGDAQQAQQALLAFVRRHFREYCKYREGVEREGEGRALSERPPAPSVRP